MKLRVATTQFSLDPVASAAAYWTRFEGLVDEAKGKGCAAVLLPEYASLSLATLEPFKGAFAERIRTFAKSGAESYCQRLQDLAAEKGIAIVGATVPWLDGPKRLINRAVIALPGKKTLFQDKLNMTRFEDEEWLVSSPTSPELCIFDLDGVPCAVATCYDIEFPSVAAAASSAGVEVIFVPSCTDLVHGYWRVRHCAHARTVECQAYVVMSSIVGGNPSIPDIDSHYGQGVILSPCDVGYPERGILAEGQLNREGIAVADLDLLLLRETRRNGTVLNLRDGKQQSPIKINRQS